MAENPKVTSKFDRMHGQPRTVTPVSSPGGTTSPGPGRSMPTARSTTPREHTAVTYHPNEHGRMERGERAEHPTHGRKENG